MAVAVEVVNSLSLDLLREPYRSRVASGAPFVTGHCYVATEAAYHLLGGRASGWRPMFIRHEGSPHWFLKNDDGRTLDLTGEQFATPVPYASAKGKGFLTERPSARARVVMDRVLRKR